MGIKVVTPGVARAMGDQVKRFGELKKGKLCEKGGAKKKR